MKNKKKINEFNDEDLFDDCPICQAMKKAKKQGRELSLEELKETFQKAKNESGIVSGE